MASSLAQTIGLTSFSETSCRESEDWSTFTECMHLLMVFGEVDVFLGFLDASAPIPAGLPPRRLRKYPGISTLCTDECHEGESPWMADLLAEGRQVQVFGV